MIKGYDARCFKAIFKNKTKDFDPVSLKLNNINEYEGRSICNENSPVYPKVLYLHTS